jgi:signal peptidase I
MTGHSGLVRGLIVAGAIVGALLSFALGSRMFVRTYRTNSASMEPAVLKGEQMVMLRTKEIRRGDLVVFHSPLHEQQAPFVHRAVAIGGDMIEIRDKMLHLNGTPVKEPHARYDDDLPESYRAMRRFGPYQVPAAHIFVLGDNRDHANDSRYLGPIPMKLVRGKIIFVFGRNGFRSVN